MKSVALVPWNIATWSHRLVKFSIYSWIFSNNFEIKNSSNWIKYIKNGIQFKIQYDSDEWNAISCPLYRHCASCAVEFFVTKMKILRTVRKRYAMLGIRPSSNQSTQNSPLNGRIILGFSLFGYLILSQLAYTFRIASDFTEYVVCISATSASFLMCVSFVAVVYRKTTLFECIANVEELINARFQLHHGNVLALSLTILSGITALALVFIACELSQRISDEFEKINWNINRFTWNLFPIEIKRMLPMIMAIAQKPAELECFGSITCSREVFKGVSVVE